MNNNLLFRIITGLLLMGFAVSVSAQKKVLNHDVYDTWKSVTKSGISQDGDFVATVINPQSDDALLFIRNVKRQKNLNIPRGYQYQFIHGSNYMVAKIKAPYTVIREAKIKKKKKENMPKDSLAIIALNNFSVTRIPKVEDFKVGTNFSRYVAYRVNDSIKTKGYDGKNLIIRNLQSGKEDTLNFVTEYVFSKNGRSIAALITPPAKDSINRKAVAYIDLNHFKISTISSGLKKYKSVHLSEDGEQVAFLATDSVDFSVYHFIASSDSASILVDQTNRNIPEEWLISEHLAPYFSSDGKRLFFGAAPKPFPKDTITPDFEKATLDIWHWQDADIQPKQLKDLDQTLKKAYLFYLELHNTENVIQLTSEEIPNVYISDKNNGRYAYGSSQKGYEIDQDWSSDATNTYDIWAFDLVNNTRKQIKKNALLNASLSPKGNYLLTYQYNDSNYYAYSFESDLEVCLTEQVNAQLFNNENEMPAKPSPYSVATWSENDNDVLVHSKYDIWKLDPKGVRKPQNITKGIGVKEHIVFRYIKPDPDCDFILPNDRLLLSAFNKKNKESGFYLSHKGELKQLIMDKYKFSKPVKAKNKHIYVYVKSNFNTSPNLHLTQNDWKNSEVLTDVNPQMPEYNWGVPELVNWTAYDGKESTGILYKPEDFDPNKKYPMIVYFYERHSDELYTYMPPAPSRSVISIPYFCSNGYLVFTPDIHYTVGNPGQNAYDYIVSGTEFLLQNSWVDKENIAIQGQSWGGYQVAYLVTRTNMFKAAAAGAPVSNMLSAYGGIRWMTGKSRQLQYEFGQSRLGKDMWEGYELYYQNSPVFFADKVETPLLIMHNDNDGAVPWYQGIEYYMALRRLKKPVWMLQYNKEAHNLNERRNAKDLSRRFEQFFGHYLKGEPMPEWMSKGVPATLKGKNFGFETESSDKP